MNRSYSTSQTNRTAILQISIDVRKTLIATPVRYQSCILEKQHSTSLVGSSDPDYVTNPLPGWAN